MNFNMLKEDQRFSKLYYDYIDKVKPDTLIENLP